MKSRSCLVPGSEDREVTVQKKNFLMTLAKTVTFRQKICDTVFGNVIRNGIVFAGTDPLASKLLLNKKCEFVMSKMSIYSVWVYNLVKTRKSFGQLNILLKIQDFINLVIVHWLFLSYSTDLIRSESSCCFLHTSTLVCPLSIRMLKILWKVEHLLHFPYFSKN